MDKAIVKTDIQIAVPQGYYGRVGELSLIMQLWLYQFVLVTPLTNISLLLSSSSAPRSGLAAKYFIDVGGEFLPTQKLSRKYFDLFSNVPVSCAQLEL